jgi:hypothetical protein
MQTQAPRTARQTWEPIRPASRGLARISCLAFAAWMLLMQRQIKALAAQHLVAQNNAMIADRNLPLTLDQLPYL